MPYSVIDAWRMERSAGALILTLDRAQAGNALDQATIAALGARLDAAAHAMAAAREVAAGLDRGAKAVLRPQNREQNREKAAAIFADLWFTTDHREAEAAFAEKWEPIFHGH